MYCPVGYSLDNSTLTCKAVVEINDCLPGYYFSPGRRTCVTCPENSYWDNKTEECFACPVGTAFDKKVNECLGIFTVINNTNTNTTTNNNTSTFVATEQSCKTLYKFFNGR